MTTMLNRPLPTLRRIALVVLLCGLAVPGLAQQSKTSFLQAARSADRAAFRAAPMAGVQGDEDWSTQFALSGVYGAASAVAVSGDDVFIGGFFDFAGTATNAISIVRWNATTQTWSALGSTVDDVGVFAAAGATGTVNAIVVRGNRVFVGGDFEFVGNINNLIPAQRVAVYDMTTETWSALGTGFNQRVRTLEATADGSIVFAGGDFDVVQGVQGNQRLVNYVAQINTTNGTDWQPMDAGMSFYVYSLQLLGNDLYAGGEFAQSGGTTVNSIARWDGTAWQPLMEADGDVGVGCTIGTNLCTVTNIVTDGTDLFLSGAFITAGGETANRIAKWSVASNTFSTLGNGFNNQVNGLALDGTTLYATGSFTQSGAVTVVNGIASYPDISVNNGNWMSLGTGIENNGAGADVAAADGSVYVAGAIEQVGGLQARGIARWDVAGQAWRTLTPDDRRQGLLGRIGEGALGFAAAATNDAVYVGGSFQIAGNVVANHIARFDPAAGTWSALGSGVEPFQGRVLTIAAQGSRVFAGGSFTEAGGQPAGNIAMYDTGTGQWDDLGGGANGTIHALEMTPNGRFLFAGGEFTSIGGVNASNIAVYDTQTEQWASLGNGTDSFVFALQLDAAGDLYVGGFFAQAGGGAVNGVARWTASSAAPTWEPLVDANNSVTGVNSVVTSLETDGTDIFLGGGFTSAGGTAASSVARWSPATQTFSPIGDGFDNVVRTLHQAPDGMLYAGGDFTASGATPINFIAQWDAAAGTWNPLGSGINGPVEAITSFGTNDLYIAGQFFAAGPHAAFGITRYTTNSPPIATDDTAEVLFGLSVQIDVLANDSDADGDPLTVLNIVMPPTNGIIQINADQSITYSPFIAFSGQDTFVYRVSDGQGATAQATVTVTVQPNQNPVAVDDNVMTGFEQVVEIQVLANDSDPEGHTLSLSGITTPPANGQAEIINAGQTIRYTPDDGFTGQDTFVYRVVDMLFGQPAGGMAEATVTVTVTGDASLQLIHNAAGAGTVDIYLNDTRVADDLAFQQATPFMTTAAGDAKIDVTASSAADNSTPLFTKTVTVQAAQAYVGIALGEIGTTFDVVVKSEARMAAGDATKVEFFIAHGAADAPALDVRLLDTSSDHNVTNFLANRLGFGETTGYLSLTPAALVNIDAVNAADDTDLLGVFRFDLSAMTGQTFTLLASGQRADNSFALIGFDANGNPVTGVLATGTDEQAALPAAFALSGNYPNPFNPTTTLRFDLPEPARVSVALYDLLGRRVLVLPAKQLAAGANRTVEVDASDLASGMYIYQVIAQMATQSQVRTGRMTLVK